MRCFGIIKFYDDQVNLFGVITDVETEAKESLDDVKFKEKNLISELDRNSQGQLVVFHLKQEVKKFADEVQILQDIETPEILAVSQFLNKEKLLIAYRILSHRGYKLNDYQLIPFYQSILEGGIDPQFFWDLWEISKDLKSSEQEIFFKFLDESIFCDGVSRLSVSNFKYLENSEVLDSYISRCIEVKSSSVFNLHQYLFERKQKENANRLIPTILEIKNYNKPIYYWNKIIESLPNYEEFLNSTDLPNKIIEGYLLEFIRICKYDEEKRNRLFIGLTVLINRNNEIHEELITQYIKNGIPLDDTTNWYFISNYWDRVLSNKQEFIINQELATIIKSYPRNTQQLIRLVVKAKKTLYPSLIKAVEVSKEKNELLYYIYQEISDIHLKFPLFFINQILENVKNLPDFDFLTFSLEFKKMFRDRSQIKFTSEEQVVVKYCVREGLRLLNREALCTFLYDFFLSDVGFFLKMREQLLSETRDYLIKESAEVFDQFYLRWKEDLEVRFLISFIGISTQINQSVDRLTLDLILAKIQPEFEIQVVYYFTKKNLNETEIKEKLRDFIVNHNFKSFSGIILKNLLVLHNPTETLVLNQLTKSFYEGYTIFAKTGFVELKEYFSLNTLIRKCKGRTKFRPIDYEYLNYQSSQSSQSNLTPTFCEGKFWKFAGETEHFSNQPTKAEIYWCRGDHCAKPNRKSNSESDFYQYSLCEISEAYKTVYTDLLYATIAGWANRVEEILPRLKCRSCKSVLFPVPYVPKKLGYYATPVFNCLNDGCLEREIVIRITHCIKCHKVVDSRDATKCSNGLLICHDNNCKGCCDEHKKKESQPIYRQKR
jgi:hypothetical protein